MADTSENISSADRFRLWSEVASSRQVLYSVLSQVYRVEPSPDFLRALQRPEFHEVFEEFHVDPLLAIVAGQEDAAAELLAVEYARLFLGPGAHTSPHESVHAREAGGLNGPETAEVRKFIEAAGFVPEEGHAGLPDHISVELEFLAHLVAQESTAWTDGSLERCHNAVSWQYRFIVDHLDKWVEAFGQSLTDQAPHSYYREFMDVLRRFISDEKSLLRDQMGESSPWK